jgi:hypothetical protein
MSGKTYDQAALIEAYIAANRTDYLHEDFTTYYKALLATLEQAFGLLVSSQGIRRAEVRPLWLLFQSTMRSYLAIKTTRSGFLEAGLLEKRLDELGDEALPIRQAEQTISRLAEESRAAHLQLLADLFTVLFGPLEKVVTSADLQALGFDDSKEPSISDYWDYA